MTKKQQAFVDTVKKFYTAHGRHDLPWRQTHDPYHILVSEIMLQQTQVARVVPKYEAFIEKFPTVDVLAHAPLGAVLSLWQGLGYNRRAKFLHECAKVVARDYGGIFPPDAASLRTLPGIGPYTASAVLAFAFDSPTVLIETNVRTAYLHHFFRSGVAVPDSALLPIIAATLDTKDSRAWYYALMDYGSYLKATVGNKNTQSKHYTKQAKFVGSDREIRGAIIRTLIHMPGTVSVAQLKQLNPTVEIPRLLTQLQALPAEGLIVKAGVKFQLPI